MKALIVFLAMGLATLGFAASGGPNSFNTERDSDNLGIHHVVPVNRLGTPLATPNVATATPVFTNTPVPTNTPLPTFVAYPTQIPNGTAIPVNCVNSLGQTCTTVPTNTPVPTATAVPSQFTYLPTPGGGYASLNAQQTAIAVATVGDLGSTQSLMATAMTTPRPFTSGSPGSVSPAAGATFNFWPVTAAYSASTVAAFAPPNAIGDRWTFENRGTNLCFITYLDFTSRASTSATRTIQLARRSTYDTGGSSVTVTNTAQDSTSAASGVTVKQWTTQPADGTFQGNFWCAQYDDMQVTSGNGQSQIRQYNFVQNGESPIVVRPGESLALHDMNGTNAAAEWTVSVKWSEGRNN